MPTALTGGESGQSYADAVIEENHPSLHGGRAGAGFGARAVPKG